MNKEDLKTCPFCGDDDIKAVLQKHEKGKEFNMQCMGCGAIGGNIGYNAANGDINYAYKSMTKYWNTRSSEPLDEKELEKLLINQGIIAKTPKELAKAICDHFCKPEVKNDRETTRKLKLEMIDIFGDYDKDHYKRIDKAVDNIFKKIEDRT